MLHHPMLWHVGRKSIALGAATGVFFGLLLPVGQIPVAVFAAIALRANVPMALVSTFITNPLTYAPIYYLAYSIGALLTGTEHAAQLASMEMDAGSAVTLLPRLWSDQLLAFGRPLFTGLVALACSVALLCYLTISGFWHVLTYRTWRKRSQRTSANRRIPTSRD